MIVVLYTIVSVWLHELGHAAACVLMNDRLGSRRWTLRPFVNLDPIFSILVPVATSLLSGGVVCAGIGRPFLLERSSIRVLVAGPAMNALLALLGWLAGNAILFKLNVLLVVINLLPIPPLDGWGIVHGVREWVLRREVARERARLHRRLVGIQNAEEP